MTDYTKTPMTRINAIWILEKRVKCNKEEKEEAIQLAINALKREQQLLDAGHKNGKVEFYIGGRKFMAKELAQ